LHKQSVAETRRIYSQWIQYELFIKILVSFIQILTKMKNPGNNALFPGEFIDNFIFPNPDVMKFLRPGTQ